MSADDEGHRRQLVDDLLPDAKSQRLYQTSVTFRARVRTLAEMLPLMVAGFALEAEKVDREREQVEAMLRSAPPQVLLLPDGTIRHYSPGDFTQTVDPRDPT